MTYKEYLKTQHWKEVREFKLLKYGYKCQLCGSENDIHIHHNNYECLFNENIHTDLISMCNECHKKFHDVLSTAPEEVYNEEDYPGFWPVIELPDGTIIKGPIETIKKEVAV